jgi:dolichol-phosphate mannosyltransferase
MRGDFVRVTMTEELETTAVTSRKTGDGLCVAVVAMVTGVTLLRFLLCGVIELIPEEAYYWTYAKHPALGYFDHPPMVAWFVTLGTAMLGDTAMGVRIMTFVLWVATAGLLFLTGRMWFGKRVALLATLMYTLAPVYVGTGLIVTPDAPLLFFWVATLYLISKALHTGRGWYWLLAGITFGGALLSKYYALLLAPSLLWFLLLSPRHRHWLRRVEPWLALPIALAVFSPVIVWNSHHDWASFLFQSSRTSGTPTHAWRDVLLFWLVQLGVLTPLLFALFAAAAARGVRRGWLEHDDNWNFVASFSLPLFCLFAAACFKTQIHVNWTAPAFLSLSLGASALTLDGLESDQPTRAKRWRWGAGATVFLCGLAIVFGHTSLAWGVPKSFVYAHAGGWEETAWHVDIARGQVQKETNQEPFLLGMDKYNIAAELGYYLGTPDNCVNLFATGGQGLGYRYWTDLRKFEGRPAIAVIPVPKSKDDTIAAIPKPSRDIMAQLRLHFERVGEPQRLGVATYRGLDRQVYLVICTGYHAAESKAPDPR